ncbi:hypothetical protein ECZU36_15480 [Escherichia coli]|nr:hypothetical protein ECZU36_15480 [Escherichia coli]
MDQTGKWRSDANLGQPFTPASGNFPVGISDLADIISKSVYIPSFLAEGVALLRPTYFYAAVPMDVSYLLDSLNDKQREAVAAQQPSGAGGRGQW